MIKLGHETNEPVKKIWSCILSELQYTFIGVNEENIADGFIFYFFSPVFICFLMISQHYKVKLFWNGPL